MSVTQANLLGDTLGSKASGTIPVGGIIMWSGSVATIPTGWSLCNGSNGTPDLRDRFVVGAGSGYSPGNTGGTADAIIPYHNHTATSSVADPGHNHPERSGIPNRGTSSGGGRDGCSEVDRTTGPSLTGITVSTTVNYAGTSGNATNANLPPYYALAFIMRVS